jgi:hypothetical protein
MADSGEDGPPDELASFDESEPDDVAENVRLQRCLVFDVSVLTAHELDKRSPDNETSPRFVPSTTGQSCLLLSIILLASGDFSTCR